MIFRITDYVQRGTLDNRERGTIRLVLHLMGMPHPVRITLQGACLPLCRTSSAALRET